MLDTSEHILTCDISDAGHSGRGVARLEDGTTLFVQGAVPGDQVRVRVPAEGGRYRDGELLETLRRSEHRGERVCAVQGQCGGCDWLDVPAPTRHGWQLTSLVAGLKRVGVDVDLNEVKVLADSPQAYRSRVMLRVERQADQVVVGYFARGSQTVLPISDCPIAVPAIGELIAELPTMFASAAIPEGGRCRLVLHQVCDGLLATVYPDQRGERWPQELVNPLRVRPGVAWAGLVTERQQAPAFVYDRHLDCQFLTYPAQFQQVNLVLNRQVRELVCDVAEELSATRVLDLFCGSGNLSLALAMRGCEVVGVEANKEAVACAKAAVQLNQVEAEYIATGADTHLWALAKKRNGPTYDLVVLDPPREGLQKGVAPLQRLEPNNILYMSCDPSSLARDLGRLCRKQRYHIKQLWAVDFFPGTTHLETLVWLQRSI